MDFRWARRNPAPLVLLLMLGGASACGDSTPQSQNVSTVAGAESSSIEPTTTDVTTSSALDVPSTTNAVSLKNYRVVAGDSLFEIARQNCSSIENLVAANDWTDGASHLIHPDDSMLVPDVPCGAVTAPSAPTDATTTTAGGHIVVSDTYVLWGDPADYGAIYATPKCTELRDALNGLSSDPVWDEDGDLGDEPDQVATRFIAAVAAMFESPSAAQLAAINRAVAAYTRNRPVYAKLQWDLFNRDIAMEDNPAWPAMWADISSSEVDRDVMWRYVQETCPEIGNSETETST